MLQQEKYDKEKYFENNLHNARSSTYTTGMCSHVRDRSMRWRMVGISAAEQKALEGSSHSLPIGNWQQRQ